MRHRSVLAGAALAAACAWGNPARAQLSTDDLANMPPTVDQIERNRMSAFTGLTVIDGDPYWRVDLRPEFAFGKLGVGLKAVLLIGSPEPDDPNAEQTTKLLTEDGESWDSASSFLRAIRYVRWGQPRSPLYARFGELWDTSIGHGLLMDGYSNLDRRGGRLNVHRDAWGFESMLNNFAAPELFGGRVYVKPLRLGGGGAPIIGGLTFGATYLTDINPIPDRLSDSEDPLIAVAADAALPILETDSFLLKLYDEIGVVAYPDPAGGDAASRAGNAVGVGLELASLRGKLEYRTFEKGFVPSLFGYDYESQARGAGIALDPSADSTKGVYGTATLSLMNTVFLSGLFEDYDGDGPVGEPRLGLRLIETDLLQPVDLRAFYIKRGIASGEGESFWEDLFDLDEKSLLVVELAYHISGPFQIVTTHEYRFREKEDGEGYERIRKTSVQFGVNFTF